MDKQRHTLKFVAVFSAYFIGGKLGLTLAFLHPSATAVWPCSGIALAALLVLGYDIWPAILLGAFLVNMTTAGSVATSIGIAAGNTLEALLGAYLVRRFAHGADALSRTPDIFRFAVLAAGVSTAVSATIGVASLELGGFAAWKDSGPIWLTWWLGDAVGDLIVVPVLLLWIAQPRVRWRRTQILEAAALLGSLLVAGEIVFNGAFIPGIDNYSLEYLCIPILLWAASRFEEREAATATLILAGIAVWGTLHGLGPFARESRNESFLLLQSFLGVGAVMTMVLAAEVAERRRAELKAVSLSVSDPLTGLGNYRRLIDGLDAEIRRAERMKRTFVVLLLDLDGLKAVNDRHGHHAGNRALCRLANVLRIQCRTSDTVARYGGDEFAAVIPEAGPDAARHLVGRIARELAADPEHPPLSVSIGAAVWRHDGTTAEELLKSADRALYEMKRGHGGKAAAMTAS